MKLMNKKILSSKSWLKSLLASFLVAGLFSISAQAANTVSVSNYPLFLLSEAVTAGAPSAKKLLNPGEVGHHGSISPKDIKAIQESTFVVWFGAPLENNLASTLDSAPNAISLFAFDAFKRYPMRDVKGETIANTLDTHIWLDPQNAKAITRALAVIHSHADPKNKTLYHANAQKFAQRMDRAVAAQKRSGQSVRAYWAYHDAYQYLEPSLNLQLVGSLSSDHHLAPKASQLRWLGEQRPNKRMCLVTQSKPAKGLITKLQPVKTTIQLEDMSGSNDFVTGWSEMAQQIMQCTS
ncbi:metal ABC transporter solute-binding protein, Zn/Mn family [Psychrobacter sp. 1U2]|uniref:metal ABC transporter solute-binding protein, Zn/Mn family n=1 Tax=Psychrobacter sp. 1U2 TaxID=3453577 RepID=UPI003F48B362